MSSSQSRPVVLCFGGHDPSGGAGIQADIEAIAAARCHAVTLVTALTEQDTRQVYNYQLTNPKILMNQARRVCADMTPTAIKVGMVGSAAIVGVIAEIAGQHAHLPLVIDPVLAAGFGGPLGADDLAEELFNRLISIATLVTPNTEELIKLTGESNERVAANRLLGVGCGAVLVTGTHADTPEVVNTLYRHNQPPLLQVWPRLPDSYHGSGCTLSSAIAARLACGEGLEAAVIDAQAYTWNSLQRAARLGGGQWLPVRVQG